MPKPSLTVWWKFIDNAGLRPEVQAWIDDRVIEFTAIDSLPPEEAQAKALDQARLKWKPRKNPKKPKPIAIPQLGRNLESALTPDEISECVRWVVTNLSRILVRIADGYEVNRRVLAMAPRNACITFAELAASHPLDFHRLYVSKLVTKLEKAEDGTPEDSDPGLADLYKLLNCHGLEKPDAAVSEVGG